MTKEEKGQEFPCWLYHKKDGSKLINSAEEFKALGKGWFDSPAKFKDSKEDKPTEDKPMGALPKLGK